MRLLPVVTSIAVIMLMNMAAAQETKVSPAPHRSLMFTAPEIAQVMTAISEAGKPRSAQHAPSADAEPSKPSVPNIYLSGVADYGPGRWTAWMNGARVIPGHGMPGFKIVSVHDDQVVIDIDGESPTRVTLRPHQTWLSASNDVVEGIVP